MGIKVETILEEDEVSNMNFPNTTKHEGRREMTYHLKTRNKSPADKLEGRMLENSLASKVDYSFETRECCKANLQRDIKKIKSGNFTDDSKASAISEHCHGGLVKDQNMKMEQKKMSLNIHPGNFADPIDLRGGGSKTTKSPRRLNKLK